MDVTEMIRRHQYDSDSANMVFMEEDIDWEVINIKMTADKTGKQHPTWSYNILYAKDEKIHEHDTHWVDKIIVEANPIGEPQPYTKPEYETISVNEEFDVEMGEWKNNEAFRLIFDPKGKIRPIVELLSWNDVVDEGPASCDPDIPKLSSPIPDSSPTIPNSYSMQTSTHTDSSPTNPNADPIPTNQNADPISTNQNADPISTNPNPVTMEPMQPEQSNIAKGQTNGKDEIFERLSRSTICTFILPDIHQFEKDFGRFVKDELIDIHMLLKLTTNGGINWWADIKGCCKLFPLWTLQNQSSLLSAVNFVLYGFNNNVISLQKSLHSILLDPFINSSLKRRWYYTLWKEQSQLGKPMYSSGELEDKWQNVTKGSWFNHLTNPESPNNQSKKCDVKPIHIYMIANLLRRPIIVLSEVKEMEGILNKIDHNKMSLNGIYLPFEQKLEECHKFPIILGCHSFHFSALVTTDKKTHTLTSNNLPACIPVMDSHLRLLPIHFVACPGAQWKPDNQNKIPVLTDAEKLEVLDNYLHLFQVKFSKKAYDWTANCQNKQLNSSQSDKTNNFLVAAKTDINKMPDNYERMFKKYVKSAKKRHRKMRNKKVKCKGTGCSQIPSSQLGGVCLQCYQRTLLNHQGE